MTANTSRAVVLVICLAAAALHLYENTLRSSATFSWGWFVWQMVPYGFIALLHRFRSLSMAVMPAAPIALAIDLLTHYEVFVAPTSSSAALLIVWLPLWSTLVVVPVVTGITWVVLRIRSKRRSNAPPA